MQISCQIVCVLMKTKLGRQRVRHYSENSARDNKERVISDSKGTANQSASKVQNYQTEKQTNRLHFKTRCLTA